MVQHTSVPYADDCRANHIGVFKDSGLEVKHYRYYNKKNIGLDLDGMIEDIKAFP
jgi:aspartate aminotransferase, mitochondrial